MQLFYPHNHQSVLNTIIQIPYFLKDYEIYYHNMVRKRPAPLKKNEPNISFIKVLFSPFFKTSPRLQYEPTDSPFTLFSSDALTSTDRHSSLELDWLQAVLGATTDLMCVFEDKHLDIRILHISRCLNAPGHTQEGIKAMEDVRNMFLKESSAHQSLDKDNENDTDPGQFSQSRSKLKDDRHWAQEAVNSLVTLMKVLACEGVALDIFSLLRLLTVGSRNGVTAETKIMRLDLVEYALRLEFDIVVLNGTSVLV